MTTIIPSIDKRKPVAATIDRTVETGSARCSCRADPHWKGIQSLCRAPVLFPARNCWNRNCSFIWETATRCLNTSGRGNLGHAPSPLDSSWHCFSALLGLNEY